MSSQPNTPSGGRRRFIQNLAIGTASIAVAPVAAHSMTETETSSTNLLPDDPVAWINRIQGKHKVVFDCTQPHELFPFAWPRVFLLTNQATGATEKDCCVVVVLRHAAIPYAFQHEAWEKYPIGDIFKAVDPLTKKNTNTNPFWKPAAGTYKFPGIGEVAIGINELMASGVMFCVCEAAMTVYANSIAGSLNKKPEDILSDWKKNLIPGIQPVPSGVWALGRAQEKGCGYIFAG